MTEGFESRVHTHGAWDMGASEASIIRNKADTSRKWYDETTSAEGHHGVPCSSVTVRRVILLLPWMVA